MKIDNLSLDHIINEDVELIPLMSEEEEKKYKKQPIPEVLPILSLKNTVLFPGVVVPITAGRNQSIKLLEDAYKADKIIGVVSQKNTKLDVPLPTDIYEIGTVARILKMLKMPDGNTTVILQGIKRFEWIEMLQTEPYFKATIKVIEDKKPSNKNKEYQAVIDSVKDMALRIVDINPALPSEASMAINSIESPSFLVNFVSSNLNLTISEKQSLLEITNLKDRATAAMKFMGLELQKLELKNDIQSKVRVDMDQQQREYFLHQQMKTIQEELGGVSSEAEIESMRERAKTKAWSEETKIQFEKELNRMLRLNPQMPEHSIQRNYLEFMLDLPWNEVTKDDFDLKKAQKILDRDHFGLEDIKERIIEYLAVLKLKGDMKSPIICLYGPPGVGKTSLGKSVAESLGRKYIRMSLGGLHDESEVRGHRKTYIGAMPGRILQSIKKAGSSNPVFILDEIDKMGSSAHGDPSSAMLEVLDPEQNNSFYDNYLEQGYDLSKVFFIATANNVADIPMPLRDRMEMVNIAGYTIEEKVEIAFKYLLPKQLKEHGLKKDDISISKKDLEFLVETYTRESGVRNLEQQIAKVVRNTAKKIAMEETYEKKFTPEMIREILGPGRNKDKYETNEVPGVVTGLAWTRVGGDILFIESILSKGKGNLTITGNLGNVMKESARIALEYIKAHADELQIKYEVFDNYNLHIHVPEGATPKDGPSAGITMLTSLVSSFTQRKVKANLAMTGEITLRGKVLAVGGIKEKILAAKRAGIKEIILSEENRKDIEEIKAEYIKGLKFHYVTEMMDVLKIALLKQKVKGARVL
ncbi:endopeptidase La [Moheibacter sediminis]|uniref:Lon protease n=1 Tax=Moheibacter sediminis TaxID=1434700 RepID=A0A1W2AIM2_9FLAO|nr:endopeptidase La [Moheibacter sediminis]SMC60483.1 ATP-dependent Lon protease [Moheibacter sediminis]